MGVERHAGAALADEIAASPENLALTIGSLEQRLTRFADESAVAYATLVQLDEALTHLGTAPRAGQEWGLGAPTLPVQGAWKAVTAVVSKALTDAIGNTVALKNVPSGTAIRCSPRIIEASSTAADFVAFFG